MSPLRSGLRCASPRQAATAVQIFVVRARSCRIVLRMKTKIFGGRARHSMRAAIVVRTGGGQRTAHPTHCADCLRDLISFVVVFNLCCGKSSVQERRKGSRDAPSRRRGSDALVATGQKYEHLVRGSFAAKVAAVTSLRRGVAATIANSGNPRFTTPCCLNEFSDPGSHRLHRLSTCRWDRKSCPS